MRAPQGIKRTALMKATVLSCVVSLMLLTQVVAAASPSPSASSSSSSPQHPKLKYNNNNSNARRQDFRRHRGSHHLPLTDEQKADQNLQFMLSLYRSAAGPDGRPKRHRMFGSNTVQLLRPLASSVDYLLMASRDHQYTFTVEYNLEGVPLEQLVRASFVHLRSPSNSSSSSTTRGGEGSGGPALRCRAQITSLGEEEEDSQRRRTATLEPHDRWTETDITAHVSGHILQQQDDGGGSEPGRLTLTAQYWCAEPGWAQQDHHHHPSSSWWQPPCGGGGRCGRGTRAVRGWSRERRRRSGGDHLEVPSLLLYLEEDQDVDEWMEELLGMEVEVVREPPPPRPLRPSSSNNHQRYRRSKDSTNSSLPSSSSSTTSSSSSSSSGPSIHPSPDMLKGASSSSSPPSAVDRTKEHKKPSAALAGRCKLHSFRLSFKELDWGHYFIAPPIYNPRFCRGDCPRVLHYGYHSPNHAIVQTVIRDLEVGDVPAPSCVPYQYMPMSVLVVHKRKVEYRELEDMVAESCTCR